MELRYIPVKKKHVLKDNLLRLKPKYHKPIANHYYTEVKTFPRGDRVCVVCRAETTEKVIDTLYGRNLIKEIIAYPPPAKTQNWLDDHPEVIYFRVAGISTHLYFPDDRALVKYQLACA